MKVKLSLHQANRLRKQIQQKLKTIDTNFYKQININKNNAEIDLINSISQNEKIKINDRLELFFSLTKMSKILAEEIFIKNVKTKLSSLLEEAKLLETLIKVIEKNENNHELNNVDDLTRALKIINESEDSFHSINHLIDVDLSILGDKIVLKKELREINDKISKINVTNFITIEVPSNIAEEFGL